MERVVGVVLGSPLGAFSPPYSRVLALVLRDGGVVYLRQRLYNEYAGVDVDEQLILCAYVVLYEGFFDVDTYLEWRIREELRALFPGYVSIYGLVYRVYPVAVSKMERGVYVAGERTGKELCLTVVSLVTDAYAVSSAGLTMDEARRVIEEYLRSLGKPWRMHFINHNVIEYRVLYKVL